jgi:hypothetical protein
MLVDYGVGCASYLPAAPPISVKDELLTRWQAVLPASRTSSHARVQG